MSADRVTQGNLQTCLFVLRNQYGSRNRTQINADVKIGVKVCLVTGLELFMRSRTRKKKRKFAYVKARFLNHAKKTGVVFLACMLYKIMPET